MRKAIQINETKGLFAEPKAKDAFEVVSELMMLAEL